jgi:hypothetical protein
MQVSIRDTHVDIMSAKDAEKFLGLKRTGNLLRPDQPGNVMARLAVDAPKGLSGKFLRYVVLALPSSRSCYTKITAQLER